MPSLLLPDELENMNSSPTLQLLCYQPEIFLLSADKSQLGGRREEVWLAARLLITPPLVSSPSYDLLKR